MTASGGLATGYPTPNRDARSEASGAGEGVVTPMGLSTLWSSTVANASKSWNWMGKAVAEALEPVEPERDFGLNACLTSVNVNLNFIVLDYMGDKIQKPRLDNTYPMVE
tara:strand:+ start:868 stop:1194 length:327 start_codon:yes stop_codon:yes gene_type:complete